MIVEEKGGWPTTKAVYSLKSCEDPNEVFVVTKL